MNDNNHITLMDNYVIVIYDGICGFCNASLQFILKQGPSKKLRFVAFQSEVGHQVRSAMQIEEDMDSIIVVENGAYYKKSKAIFHILDHIKSNWKYLKIFRFIPTFISDFFYSIIAKYRYKIQKNECPIPTPEERELFI
ncbi:MAG: DCC1-like thiol-disulfide oxidoreductase family protein [Saprospiraceae bacterium]|nr:DCC1-like thiol-disulfide oxidoreductase family protein [Saprospiraceae bacterium]